MNVNLFTKTIFFLLFIITMKTNSLGQSTILGYSISVSKYPIDNFLSYVPGVKITANPGGIVCSGVNVTFTAYAINSNITPPYQWRKNNIIVGTNNSTYSDNNLSNNDIITCTMFRGGNSSAPVISNSIQQKVKAGPAIPVITANGPTSICANDASVVLSTSATGVLYQWQCPTSTYFSYNYSSSCSISGLMLSPGIYNVSLKVTSNGCSTYSAAVPVTILPAPASPSILVNGPLSICEGSGGVTLSTNVTASSYEWKYGGSIVSTAPTCLVNKAIKSGPYYLFIRGSNGCKSMPSNSVHVNVWYCGKPMCWLVNVNSNKYEARKSMNSLMPGNKTWYDYAGNIINNPGHYFYAPAPGYYRVRVNNNGCITPFSDFFLYQPIAEKYTLYPAPVTNSLSIVSNSLTNSISAIIENATGTTMNANFTFVAMTSINTSSYPAGTYKITLKDITTGAIETKYFTKQ